MLQIENTAQNRHIEKFFFQKTAHSFIIFRPITSEQHHHLVATGRVAADVQFRRFAEIVRYLRQTAVTLAHYAAYCC